jgi:hypothetical protein
MLQKAHQAETTLRINGWLASSSEPLAVLDHAAPAAAPAFRGALLQRRITVFTSLSALIEYFRLFFAFRAMLASSQREPPSPFI